MSDKLPLGATGAYARRVEAMGFDALHVPETLHDSMSVALLALDNTTKLTVRTSITLAFVRSPMLLALQAWDLANLSEGRFQLGLGPQIRQNIEGRFSLPWADPVGRMREYIEALHAIWHAFQTGEKLDYQGQHYTFGRLQPFFNPGPLNVDAPAIWTGGVNTKMCHLAGTHSDGFVTHPTNSNPRYLREICLPAIRAGEAEAGRAHRSVQLIVGSQYITGPDQTMVATNREHHRQLLAFLYSTPAYRRTLELFGWEDLGARLQQMTRTNSWDDLPNLVTDEVLDALVPQATWDDLPDTIAQWFGHLDVDGVILPLPDTPARDPYFAEVVRAVQAL